MADEYMMPVSTEEAIKRAELLTLRQISDTLGTLLAQSSASITTVNAVKEDVAVLKVKMEENESFRQKMEGMEKEIHELKLRNAQQDGALTLMDFVHKFGPWLVALATLAWALLGGHQPGHP